MTSSGIIGFLLIIANVIVSYRGFKDEAFLEKYKFEIEKISIYKDYKRLITSGFLHVNWMHLIMNMIGLYFFSGPVESYLGGIPFLVIYFASLIGGDLFSLVVHKYDSGYSSVGASGAVCGIMFAAITVFPGMPIGLFPLPFSVPSWLFGLAFILYSIYGIKARRNNSGHDAHLAGAIIGMLVAILFKPSALMENYITILLIGVPAIAFLYIILTNPHLLLVDELFSRKNKNYYSIDHKVNAQKAINQKEIDRILDKISQRGMNSLSKEEKREIEAVFAIGAVMLI